MTPPKKDPHRTARLNAACALRTTAVRETSRTPLPGGVELVLVRVTTRDAYNRSHVRVDVVIDGGDRRGTRAIARLSVGAAQELERAISAVVGAMDGGRL